MLLDLVGRYVPCCAWINPCTTNSKAEALLHIYRSTSATDTDQQAGKLKDAVALPFEGVKTRDNKGPTHMVLDISD